MTVKLQNTTYRYIGLSTDEKPVPTGEGEGSSEAKQMDLVLPPGSSFLENDTGKIYRWDGKSWRYTAQEDDQSQLLVAILLELRHIRTAVELATEI